MVWIANAAGLKSKVSCQITASLAGNICSDAVLLDTIKAA
jgi:hypothetical protein